MVFFLAPALVALGGLAIRLAPRIIPVIKAVAKKITIKRAVVGLVVTGAALESPALRKALVKTPTAPFKVGKVIGAKFETAIEKEIKKKPKGKVQKALEIGGIAGIATAATIVGVKALKKRKEKVIAALPVPIAEIPALAAAPITPVPIGKAPMKAIVTPAAVEVPTVKKRAVRRRVSPLVINQIQISAGIRFGFSAQ